MIALYLRALLYRIRRRKHRAGMIGNLYGVKL